MLVVALSFSLSISRLLSSAIEKDVRQGCCFRTDVSLKFSAFFCTWGWCTFVISIEVLALLRMLARQRKKKETAFISGTVMVTTNTIFQFHFCEWCFYLDGAHLLLCFWWCWFSVIYKIAKPQLMITPSIRRTLGPLTQTRRTMGVRFVLFYCLYRCSLHLSYLRPLFALLLLRFGQRIIVVYLVCMYLTLKCGLYIAM